jgi:dTDP-4-dehydrorhamnose 3,5-epimerase-like enzyme
MHILPTKILNALVIKSPVFVDNDGFSTKVTNTHLERKKTGITPNLVQDNYSIHSGKGKLVSVLALSYL